MSRIYFAGKSHNIGKVVVTPQFSEGRADVLLEVLPVEAKFLVASGKLLKVFN